MHSEAVQVRVAELAVGTLVHLDEGREGGERECGKGEEGETWEGEATGRLMV